MAGIQEHCSVCGSAFDVQFRYQMEETKGGFSFFCSHECHARSLRGEDTNGVTCDSCAKRFIVELVSQIVKTRSGRSYACSEDCRADLMKDSNQAKPAIYTAAPSVVLPSAVAPSTSPFATSPSEEAAAIESASTRPTSDIVELAPAQSDAPSVFVPYAPAPSVSLVSGDRGPVTTSADDPNRPAYRGPKHIAIFNHKGGTGKTTTTVSLAAGLAARGMRVLLIDTDSQGNVGVSLGTKLEKSLYHVLVMGIKPEEVAIRVRENLDFVGSNETLAAAELYLAGRQNRDRILKERFAKSVQNYDVVLVDCSPSLSLMNQNALVLADGIIVPVACDFLSLVGVRQVVKTVKNVNSLLHHPVQIYGVLPTFYDARAKICREAVDTLTGHFGERCMTPIRSATKIKEAPAQGKTIFEYAPESNAAEDYMRIVDQIIAGTTAPVQEVRKSA